MVVLGVDPPFLFRPVADAKVDPMVLSFAIVARGISSGCSSGLGGSMLTGETAPCHTAGAAIPGQCCPVKIGAEGGSAR